MNKTKLLLSMFVMFMLIFSACTNINDPDDKKDPKALPFIVTFETNMGGFTTQNVLGDEVWEHSVQYKYMMISGFVNQTNKANEDWLISPEIDLTEVDSAKLSFDYIARYFGILATEATVWVSENYSEGLPVTASWSQLVTEPLVSVSDWNTWTTSEVSLTTYAGKKIKIAFKYLSTTTKAGTWEIKNFKVEEGDIVAPNPPEGLNLCDDTTTPFTSLFENFDGVVNNADISLPGWKVVQVLGDRNWQGKIFTSTPNETYAQATAHNGGAPNYENWLITPPLNVGAATSKTLSFKTAKAFWTATSSLKVFVLKCEGGTTTQTEITSAYIVKETDTDHVFVSSGSIDLSAYSGTIYIGFQYIALGGSGNSTTFRIDDVWFNNTATTVSINSQAVSAAIISEAYIYNVTTNVMNPVGNTVITATGLPAWAAFTDNGNGTASITGTPNALGTHNVTITATNNSIVATQPYTLTVTNAPVAGVNLVVNSGFEDWTGALPVGWDNATYNTGVVKETTIVKSGSNSVKHISGGTALKIQQEVDVTGGKTYQISYWYLDNSPKAKTRMWSFWLAGSSTLTDHVTSLRPDDYSTNNAEWVKKELTLVAPATATKFRFEVRSYRESTTLDGDPIYYDDFSVVEVQ